MSDPKSSQETAGRAAELSDLEPTTCELSPEDAEDVRGGIIVQGGAPVSIKVTSPGTIQSFSWGVTNTG